MHKVELHKTQDQDQRTIAAVLFMFLCILAVAASCSKARSVPTDRSPAILATPISPTDQLNGAAAMPNLPGCLLGKKWIHSHEEDTDVRVYRPDTYGFPPARGRTGFEFREGGELTYVGIARSDGSDEINGRWSFVEPNQVTIELDSERIQPFTLHIRYCDDEVLRVES
jgi:hypothetical protein